MNDLTTKLADALRRIHEICGGDAWEYRQIALEALALYDAAKAQPVQDEREEFEAWLQKCHPGAVGAELIGKEENASDSYTYVGVNKQWRAWQARAALAATPAHPDDLAVDAFAAAMKDKLAKAREKGRGGWQTCPPEELSRMLREHVEKGDPRDVANFAMFLWSLRCGIAPAATPAPAEAHGWVAMWPMPGGGHGPVLTIGEVKPSYGEELDARLTVYPVYREAATPAPAEPVALRDFAERIGIRMDCWDMGAASMAYSDGCHGITRVQLERLAQMVGVSFWNAARKLEREALAATPAPAPLTTASRFDCATGQERAAFFKWFDYAFDPEADEMALNAFAAGLRAGQGKETSNG